MRGLIVLLLCDLYVTPSSDEDREEDAGTGAEEPDDGRHLQTGLHLKDTGLLTHR